MPILINNIKLHNAKIIEDYMIDLLSSGCVINYEDFNLLFEDGYFVIDSNYSPVKKKYKTLKAAINFLYK